MGACLKCGYEGHKEIFKVCDKCGAVQDKVRAFITDKIKEGLATCDELALLCESAVKRASELRAYVEKNRGVNVDWQTTCLNPLGDVDGELGKLKVQITQLKNHASAFTVSYEANKKLDKLGEYVKKFRGEVEQLSVRLDDLWTHARYAVLNHTAGAPTGFEPPKVNPEKYEVLEEIEARIHENRYPSMLIIAGVYKAIGWLSAILTVIVVAVGLYGLAEGGLAVAIGGLLIGPIVCISLFAFAESIKVGIDIEQNTRATREYMRGLFMKGISGDNRS